MVFSRTLVFDTVLLYNALLYGIQCDCKMSPYWTLIGLSSVVIKFTFLVDCDISDVVKYTCENGELPSVEDFNMDKVITLIWSRYQITFNLRHRQHSFFFFFSECCSWHLFFFFHKQLSGLNYTFSKKVIFITFRCNLVPILSMVRICFQ